MSIRVLYFASLREQLGRAEDSIAADAVSTAGDVWQQLTQREWPSNMLVAINQSQMTAESHVENGDEVAFFPPVTGG